MRILFLILTTGAFVGSSLLAQNSPSTAHHHGQIAPMPDMSSNSAPDWLPSLHASSGTGWQPAASPAHLWMKPVSGWDLMAHGVIFLDYTQAGGPRGAGKADSVNWVMLMEQHPLGKGSLLLRQMFSAESLTAPHPGFPQLFQTGETYHGSPLVDHQHPHNVFAELSVTYTRPLTNRISWLLYGGPSAEPALGPIAYMHRASGAELPMAPLSHHLQDSTHTTFGVITTGLIVDHFKFEASAFNGREPNEQRYGIQLAALDSWSARLSVAPSPHWAAQYSYGRLKHPEALEPGSERRQTASVHFIHPFSQGSIAASLVWGRKHKELSKSNLNSYLLESTLSFKTRNYAFSRLELVDKDELFSEDALPASYRIGAYTFGAARDLVRQEHWNMALGADLTFYTKPASLDATYGGNPVSFQVFLRFRPSAAGSHHGMH